MRYVYETLHLNAFNSQSTHIGGLTTMLHKHWIHLDKYNYKEKPKGTQVIGRIQNFLLKQSQSFQLTLYEILERASLPLHRGSGLKCITFFVKLNTPHVSLWIEGVD